MSGRNGRDRGRARAFLPRVEALEDRTVPAVTFLTGPGYTGTCGGGGEVQFRALSAPSGTSFALDLYYQNNGTLSYQVETTTGVGSVFATTTKGPVATAPCGAVNQIDYVASTGTDTVKFFMADVAGKPSATPLKVPLAFNVTLPGNNKGFTATFGTPTRAPVPVSAGSPPKALVPGTFVNIAPGGSLKIHIDGTHVVDNATLNYAGRVNGSLDARYIDPQGPNTKFGHDHDADKVTFTFNPTRHSGGTLHPKVLGGVGDDNLFLVVQQPGRSPRLKVPGAPQINGGLGLNTCASFPPISEVRCQM
jgi:hypothetical protein